VTRDDLQRIIEAIRAAYDTFNRDEIGSQMEHIAPDVQWIEPLSFPGGGTYRGHAGAIEYLKRAKAAWAEAISEPVDFATVGNRIMVTVRARVRPEGASKPIESTIADVYTVEDGLVTRMQAYATVGEARHELGLVSAPFLYASPSK
jgi:ketosteroid isomerase-like protein